MGEPKKPRLDPADSEQQLHLAPVDDILEHRASPDCWCQPFVIARNLNNSEIWQHRYAKENPQ